VLTLQDPAAAAWMMQHVFDHWDYSRDLPWLQSTGYLLMREVAAFWVTQLAPDKYSRDNTIVAVPCNSPEKGPTTFGCSNYQQIIRQHFMNTVIAADAVNDADSFFIASLNAAMIALDDGLHFSAWGGIKEFKLPDNMGLDMQGDKHRHLSHLVGWYPGYAIASYLGGFGNSTIEQAVAASLRSRGTGAADGNTGWAKVWRAAAWARLNDTAQADYHLRLVIHSNIGPNGLSVYDGGSGPFQIDANFGIAAAMLSMMVVDLPQPFPRTFKRRVVLGPAIPSRWGPGKIKGLRVRGGTVLDMSWNNRGVVDKVSIIKRGEPCQFLSKEGKLIGQF
jgi:alpha-L-fucosidase 2